MFGQAMATFIPPMLARGGGVHARLQSGAEIIRQIQTAAHLGAGVRAEDPGGAARVPDRSASRSSRSRTTPSSTGRCAGGATARIHRLFGWKFWSFIVGAAPLPPELEAFWSRLGFLVIQGYGLTETAPIVTLNHPFHARQGSVGKPIAGVEVKIADDGEILVRGDNVTSGYFNAPEATAEAFEDGWFHTGDVGELDESGQLRILGRKKEMIVTPEGLNVFPEDVERVLHQTPGVRDAAVIGSDRVHAVLILDGRIAAEEAVRQANAKLADYQRIRTFSIWPYAGVSPDGRHGQAEAARDCQGDAAGEPGSAGGRGRAARIADVAGAGGAHGGVGAG